MMQAGMQSPLGPISVTETDGVITALHWHAGPAPETALLAEALAQLQAYFDRRLTRFDLPLDFGSGFAEQVRRAMAAIPYGETRRSVSPALSISLTARASTAPAPLGAGWLIWARSSGCVSASSC